MGICSALVPKRFLMKYSLRFGSYIVAFFMLFLTTIIAIYVLVQTVISERCTEEYCYTAVWKQMLMVNIVACTDAFLIILANIWLLWGVWKRKQMVLLFWTIIVSVWLSQCLMLALIFLIVLKTSNISIVSWACICTIIIICVVVIIYGIVIVYAYMLQLKNGEEADDNAN